MLKGHSLACHSNVSWNVFVEVEDGEGLGQDVFVNLYPFPVVSIAGTFKFTWFCSGG